MGALTGSLSTTKLYVRGALPKNLRRSFMERITLRTFRPLEPNEEAEERAGWCVLGQPFDLDLSPDKVFVGPYLVLGLRVDRYRFPPRVVQAELAKASRAALQKSGHERLSRAHARELEKRVLAALRQRYFPSVTAVDLVWNLDAGEAYFWSQSRGSLERLGALFELCFGLTLIENGPFVAAQRCTPDGNQAELDRVERTLFHAEAADASG